jgi:hypothetical protein
VRSPEGVGQPDQATEPARAQRNAPSPSADSSAYRPKAAANTVLDRMHRQRNDLVAKPVAWHPAAAAR